MIEMKTLTIDGVTYEVVDYKARQGKLDASKLPEAINDALAQAKATGEFDGYAPARGVDYWTETDQQEVTADATALVLAEVQSTTIQQTPLFANSVEECTDTSKVYVLPDGYIYAYMGSLQYPFTNKIPLSIDSDGTPYVGLNGEQGYKTGYRINGSGNEEAEAGKAATGYIPIKKGDVVRFHNFDYVPGSKSGAMIALYKSDFTKLHAQIAESMPTASIAYLIDDVTVDSSNRLTGFTIIDKWNDGISYLRVSAPGLNSSTIITVNEEIVDPVLTYKWANTGHAFVPADYEDRIISLENASNSHESRIKTLELYGSSTTSADDIPVYIKTEADNVMNRVVEKQGNRNFNMIAMSDFHYGGMGDNKDNLIRACKAISYIKGRINIDAIATLGDNIPFGQGSEENISVAHRWFREMNEILEMTQGVGIADFRAVGNHDRMGFADEDGNPTVFMPDSAIYSYIGGYNRQSTSGDVPGGWCYNDFEWYKLRVIVLNTCECEGDRRFFISTKQFSWLVDSLDLSGKENAEDWQILILSHYPADITPDQMLSNVLNAYKTGTAYAKTSVDGETVSCDFRGKNSATLIGNIHGHLHDYTYRNLYLGTFGNSAQCDIMAISTPTTSFVTNGNPDNDGNTYSSVKDTAEETAFCVYSIDLDNHVIHAIHYGNGIDREISY